MTHYKLIYTCQDKDQRDFLYKAESDEINNLEVVYKLTTNSTVKTVTPPTSSSTFVIPLLPTIINQGNLGDCVANAFFYCIMAQTNNNINLSRLYLYANCRCIDYTPLDQDDGTTIRSACKALSNYGVCKENVYPYNIANYMLLPILSAYQNAKRFQTFTYYFLNQDLTTIKNCLSTNKVPIVFGFSVYSSFMSSSVSQTGTVPYPNIKTETLEGGHCMCIVGYNDTTQMFTCANSWGASWGNKGYCYMPYKYILDTTLTFDLCYTHFIY